MVQQLDQSRVAVVLDEQRSAPIVLGRGSFGVVYAGVLDGVYPVALKQVRVSGGSERAASERAGSGGGAHMSRRAQLRRVAQRQFAREVRRYGALRRVRSVATCYGWCRTGGEMPVLAVERLACSLHTVLRDGRLCERDALTLALSLAEAVAEVHAAGFSHGDLKPSNVLLTAMPAADGALRDGTRVKLVDFGLSRAFGAAEGDGDADGEGEDGGEDGGEERAATRVRSARSAPECTHEWHDDDDDDGRLRQQLRDVEARGTPAYVSPEGWGGACALRSRTAAQRADVFALGVMLHQLDGGDASPWRDAHQWRIFVAVALRAQRPAPPSRPRVRALAPITAAAWAQRAADRPSAAALAARLRALRAALFQKPKCAAAAVPASPTAVSALPPPPPPPPSPPPPMASSPPPSSSSSPPPASSSLSPSLSLSLSPSPSPSPPFPFKQLVLADDIGALCDALLRHERDPAAATAALEAMGVLLDERNLPNCRFVARRAALLPVAAALSRHGRAHPRLCKAACVVVLRLAAARDAPVERHLRAAGACDMVLSALRWHPSALPVLLVAACALAKLAAASAALAAIVAELGGPAAALRVLSRSVTSFHADLPVAEAAFDALHALVPNHPHALVTAGVIPAVAHCCDSFESPVIDARTVRLLYALVRTDAGKNSAVASPACLHAVSRLIDRCVQAHRPCAHTLVFAFHVVSEIANSQRSADATAVFMSTSIVPSVMESNHAIVHICTVHNLTLIHAAFDCLRSMTALGTDVCGSLQMSHVFDFTTDLIQVCPTDSTVALRAVLFLKSILHQLATSSYAADVHQVSQILSQMHQTWKSQPAIAPHVRDAIRLLEENLARHQRPNTQSTSSHPQQQQQQEQQPQQEQQQHPTRLFSRWRHSKPRSTRT